jgi:hypothetical protein
MPAGAAVGAVAGEAGARAVAVRLAAQTGALRPGARGVAFRIGRVAFSAVAALEDAEVVLVHVLVRVEPGVRARGAGLRNKCTTGAHFEMDQIRGIDVAVMIKITANVHGPGSSDEKADQ